MITHPLQQRTFFFTSVLIMFLAFCGVSYGQQSALPHFSYSKIQLLKPDLSQYERVRFLTIVDFPPFNYLNSNGALTGYNTDLIRSICEDLDIVERCQIEAVPFDELQNRLSSKGGEAIIAGLAPSLENRQVLRFSNSYLIFPARFVGLDNNALQESLNDKLTGIKIGVVANTSHEIMLRSYFPRADIKDYTDYNTLYKAILSGEVQLGFGDGLRFSLWLSQRENSATNNNKKVGFIGDPYVNKALLGGGMQIAVRLGDDKLAKAFDYSLDRLEKNGKLQELYLRYFPIGFY